MTFCSIAERYRNLLAVIGAVRDVHRRASRDCRAALSARRMALGLLNDHTRRQVHAAPRDRGPAAHGALIGATSPSGLTFR